MSRHKSIHEVFVAWFMSKLMRDVVIEQIDGFFVNRPAVARRRYTLNHWTSIWYWLAISGAIEFRENSVECIGQCNIGRRYWVAV